MTARTRTTTPKSKPVGLQDSTEAAQAVPGVEFLESFEKPARQVGATSAVFKTVKDLLDSRKPAMRIRIPEASKDTMVRSYQRAAAAQGASLAWTHEATAQGITVGVLSVGPKKTYKARETS